MEVEQEKLLRLFPVGVHGKVLELMVARPDPTFGIGVSGSEYEKLVAEICKGADLAVAQGLAN